MAISRWAPSSAFTSLEREMQDMRSRFHTRPFIEGFEWKPSTDVYEEEGKLLVRTEIPGIDPSEELTIEVEENVLHIKGEKTMEKEISEDNRYPSLHYVIAGRTHPKVPDAQAVAASVPVVATAFSHAVKLGELGAVVITPNRSPEALAEALAGLLDFPSRMSHMVAERRLAPNHEWRSVAAQYERVLREVTSIPAAV